MTVHASDRKGDGMKVAENQRGGQCTKASTLQPSAAGSEGGRSHRPRNMGGL